MPLFLGCMSSKQAKPPPDNKAKKKPEPRRDGKARDAIQNGGQQKSDEPETDVPTANPDAAAPPASHDVSLSQVDVTEHITADDVTSDKVVREDKSEKRQSFPARPATIVREDGLISEIQLMLGHSDISTADSAEKPEEASKPGTAEPDDKTPAQVTAAVSTALPGDSTPAVPDTAPTPTPTPAPTPDAATTKEAADSGTQESSDEPRPPTPPPRPKVSPPSQYVSESESAGVAETSSEDLVPPSLPPRSTVVMPTEKPPAPVVEHSMESSRGAPGEEDCPPVLPPRCVPPSPPRLSTPRQSISSISSVSSSAPPKPRRCSVDSGIPTEDQGVLIRKAKPASFRTPPPLPDDWAIIELPKTDAELIRLTKQPAQLATMASQYVAKHISLHTDVRVTPTLSEQIHGAFLSVARQQRSLLHRFLTDLIEDQANSTGGGGEGGGEPSHGAVIVLAKDILRQFVTVEAVVQPCLEILRAVSRVSGATGALVQCGVGGSVLGTMSAHKMSATIQCSCLQVLARVACCPVSPSEQPPLDRSAVDLICLSLESFPKSSAIAEAGCQVVSNLVNTLYKAVSSALDCDRSSGVEQDKWTSELLDLTDYVFSQSLPPVRKVLKCHEQEPAVKTHGRQCLVVYSQLQQLRQRKKQRLSESSSPALSPPPLPARRQPGQEQVTDSAPRDSRSSVGGVFQLDARVPNPSAYSDINVNMEYENWDLLRGVLKKKSSLRGHSYSKPDLQFMRQLTKTQVVGLVCALAVDGHVQEALNLLDQPVSEMVLTTQVPPGVRDYVAHHCSPSHTLIDLDPGLFVSLIDAIRYPSLSYQMAQKCVLEVASSLNDEQQVPVVAVTVEFLASTITNRPLAPAMTVPAFVDAVCRELERARAMSKNSGALTTLLSEIRQCARKTNHSN